MADARFTRVIRLVDGAHCERDHALPMIYIINMGFETRRMALRVHRNFIYFSVVSTNAF